jgi:hypothetical protein
VFGCLGVWVFRCLRRPQAGSQLQCRVGIGRGYTKDRRRIQVGYGSDRQKIFAMLNRSKKLYLCSQTAMNSENFYAYQLLVMGFKTKKATL